MARRKRYSAEFKRQALRRADEPGVTDALVREELGVSARQLRRWREAVQEHGEENAFPGHGKARDQEIAAMGQWPTVYRIFNDGQLFEVKRPVGDVTTVTSTPNGDS